MNRNFYDPPFVVMINSGTFWRCPHGKTRLGSKPGCGHCALVRPRHLLGFLLRRLGL
jgi:hypothetical protein